VLGSLGDLVRGASLAALLPGLFTSHSPLIRLSPLADCGLGCRPSQGAVFYQGGCFFKSTGDVAKGLKRTKLATQACIRGPAPTPSPPAPPTPPADLLTIDAAVPGRATDRGVQGAHLNPLGLFLRTSIPFIWRVLSAFPHA
jgi:hypothetical protein